MAPIRSLAVLLALACQLGCGDDGTTPEEPPLVESLALSAAPAAAAGLTVSCKSGPDSLPNAPTCPVLRWLGRTYWAFSHSDNRVGMTIVATDASGIVVKQMEKAGARYVWRITVDATARSATFWGQSSLSFTVGWDELR